MPDHRPVLHQFIATATPVRFDTEVCDTTRINAPFAEAFDKHDPGNCHSSSGM